VPIVLKSGSLNLLEPSGPVQACNGIALPFYLPTDLADLEARTIAAVENIDVPMLTRMWQELEYRIDACPMLHASNISSCQKKNFSVFLWL